MKYIKIDIQTKGEGSLPPFIGSMLRGGFGVNLKRVVCINPNYECEGCFAKEECLYYKFYEERNRFHNFRFDFPLYPKKLDFSLYLFNDATPKYPYVLSSLHRMITKEGLGRERKRYEIELIKANDKVIYDDGKFKEIAIEPRHFFCEEYSPVAKVKLLTPLRIKREGRYVKPENLEAKDLLVSIYKKRRFFDGEIAEIASFPETVMKDLKFQDFTRYSNRQKTKMKVGGILGELLLKDLTPQTYELLKFGEIVGVGKLGTFGLGKIEVEPLV